MNTKEAIELIDAVFSKCRLKKCNLQNLNKIIYLLQRGERFENMWGELNNIWPTTDWDYRDYQEAIGIIESKYFPKGIEK